MHAVNTYWGSGGITPLILKLGSRWEEWNVRKQKARYSPHVTIKILFYTETNALMWVRTGTGSRPM